MSKMTVDQKIAQAIDTRTLTIEHIDRKEVMEEMHAKLVIFLARIGCHFQARNGVIGDGLYKTTLQVSIDDLGRLIGSKEADTLVRTIYLHERQFDVLHDAVASYLVRWLVPSVILPRYRGLFREVQKEIDALNEVEQTLAPSNREPMVRQIANASRNFLSKYATVLSEGMSEAEADEKGSRKGRREAGIHLISTVAKLMLQGERPHDEDGTLPVI